MYQNTTKLLRNVYDVSNMNISCVSDDVVLTSDVENEVLVFSLKYSAGIIIRVYVGL